HDIRNIPHGAGSRRRDVRAGGLWTHRNHDDRGYAVKAIFGSWGPPSGGPRESPAKVGHHVRRAHAAVSIATIAFIAVLCCLRLGPLPAGLLDDPTSISTTVLDRTGAVLYEARSKDGTRDARLTADALPENVVNATIAAEDQRFWRHHGVDPLAIFR